MKAIVIGGGIGGATTALALLNNGIEVEVYEQARQMSEIGAGLQIAPNASTVLIDLGLGAELERLGVAMEALQMRDLRSDRTIHSLPRDRARASAGATAQRWGGPFYQLHRPDLLGMLVAALPAGVARLGERAEAFTQDDDGVTVRFESGHQTRGDLLIGADGIHSIVRRRLFGEETLDFSNIVAWRALIPRPKLEHLDLPRDCHVWLGPSRSAVAYWVHRGELLNFVGMVPAAEASEESWTATGELGALRSSFADCCDRLDAIIGEIETPFITGYYFRYPLPRWTEGRVTLVGDAAHPMHPFLAQGACQAIEDAGTLGHVLAARGPAEMPDALLEYQQRRLARASQVQNLSRTQAHVWHMSDPREIVQRNRTLGSLMDVDPEADTIYGWVYRHDVKAQATRPLVDPATTLERPEARRAWRLWATMLEPRDLDRQHHGIRDAYDRFLERNSPVAPGVEIDESDRSGRPHLVATANTHSDAPIALHLHGGGYLVGSPRSSVGLASRLARALGGVCIVPGYRRAPEHPYPAALEDALAAYEQLLADGIEPARILLTGESAGGALAVAVGMRLRDLGIPLPAGIVAMCPMADLAITGRTVDGTAGKDPICTRRLLTQMATSYLQGHDPREPLASPIYGDYRGLPPLLVQTAENEALYADAVRMAEAARRDGVHVELDAYHDTVHVFHVFDFLPESRRALARISEFTQAVSRRGIPSRS
jgi:salicylate hydroxylase